MSLLNSEKNHNRKAEKPNNSLKPTITHVTPFAEETKLAPHYGGLIPPFYVLILKKHNLKGSIKEKSLAIYLFL